MSGSRHRFCAALESAKTKGPVLDKYIATRAEVLWQWPCLEGE